MLFAFIFMGVSAFSEANGFSAVINSILPAVAGLSMGSGKTDYSKINQQISKNGSNLRNPDQQNHQSNQELVISPKNS